MNPRYLSQYFGETGVATITTADGPVTGNYAIIEVLSNATAFTTLTDEYDEGLSDPTDVTYDAGAVLRGKFTAITVSAGAVRAYKSAPM